MANAIFELFILFSMVTPQQRNKSFQFLLRHPSVEALQQRVMGVGVLACPRFVDAEKRIDLVSPVHWGWRQCCIVIQVYIERYDDDDEWRSKLGLQFLPSSTINSAEQPPPRDIVRLSYSSSAESS